MLTVKKVGDINDCEVNNILAANVMIFFLHTWSCFQDQLHNFKNHVMYVNIFDMQLL
jgi:hypothetical protein